MRIDKKIAHARAPEEPINGALDESDWGGRTKRAALTTSTCQETKKGENNIQAQELIYPPAPKQSTEKRTLHIIHTLHRPPHPSK